MSGKKINAQILPFLPEMVAIRHQLHTSPELGFEEEQTSRLVAEKLAGWGFEVTKIAGTGLVGTLRCGKGRRTIGLRADMDALPVYEETNLPYASKSSGRMHACGHDGHTTTLLAAARYLANTKNFNGTVHVIFQPAEEGLGGAHKMVEEGLFERFPCDAVYGFHNVPGIPSGQFLFMPDAVTAASDKARIIVRGKSGHGAQPQNAVDPIVVGAAIVSSIQTIISRNIDPQEAGVVTIGAFLSGEAFNIIPNEAELRLTARSYAPELRDFIEQRLRDIVRHQAAVFGAEAELDYERITPACRNDAAMTEFAQHVATDTFGKAALAAPRKPFTFGDDFAFMLEKCPGSYFFIGNGDSADLHNSRYDFNDELIGIGASFWGALVEKFLA